MVSSKMIKSSGKHLVTSGNTVSVRAIPTFSFEHWKGNNSGALIKLIKKTDDPLIVFKSFISSRTQNHDMVNVFSSNDNYVDPMFTIRDLQGWNERYGLPYAYQKFLQACDLDKYYEPIPMDADISKIKKAPLRA
jgi:hypothetical protein